MQGHFHAVVWIDHRQARIFHFNATDADKLVGGSGKPGAPPPPQGEQHR